ncbi:MAG: hypothetical protein GF331_25795, partial [Chitinivibrionales bacterium]|nr:hypothetical protein [Chitinivibrionales bacterium]
MRQRHFASTVLALVTLVFGSAMAADGYRTFHIGNSLTDETYGMNEAAVSLGHTGVEWGRYMI